MSTARRRDNFTARIAPEELELLKRAADVSGKSLSSFVIEAATLSAHKTLLDQRFMHLDENVFASVSETLAKPAKTHPELVELLRSKTEWATSER